MAKKPEPYRPNNRPGVSRGVLVWVVGCLALILAAALIGGVIGLWREW